MNIFKHGLHLEKKEKSYLLFQARFCAAGGIGVSVGYIALYSLTEYMHVWYILSSIVASILNCAIDFFLQKYWAFHNPDRSHLRKQLRLYVIMYFALFAINTTFLYIFVHYLKIYYLFAQIVLTFALSGISYVVTRSIFDTKRS